MNKQSKIMTSRFDSHCDNCRNGIQAGDTIKWVSKGVVECMDCASLPTPQENMRGIAPLAGVPTVGSVADQWTAAMSWEETAPEPGSSINIDKPAIVPTKIQAPSGPVNIMSLVDKHPQSAKTAFNTPLPTRGPDLNSKVSNQAVKPEPVIAPTSDPMTALLSDQLVTLVNALHNASSDQHADLKLFCEQLGRASDSSSRARAWELLAVAVA